MDKDIYVYYAHRLYFKGKWEDLTKEDYFAIPEGSYIYHTYKNKWILKGDPIFLEDYSVPIETKAAHLIESM